MYINTYDKNGNCAVRGKKAEDLFEDWLKRDDIPYEPATLEQQYDHIDYVVYSQRLKRYVTIDVKASKKINRDDEDTTEECIWVEFKNVQGRNGWLYGKNEYLAFHKPSENCFYVVKTETLARLCEKLCVGKVFKASDAFHKRYTRYGRKDEIGIIDFDDLKQIPFGKISLDKN